MIKIHNGMKQQRENVDLAIAYLDQLTNTGKGNNEMELMDKISQHQSKDDNERLPIDIEKVISRKMKRQNEAC
jgi:hypothetical protein